jgi:selenide,water dikinase
LEDLVQVLKDLPVAQHPDLLVGTETGDDAAVYRLNEDTALILTVDFFTPITDDPYEFGSIAAANSLSDVYAMGGKPLLALNVVGFPADLAGDMLGTVLQGGHAKATEAGCLIVGGHTVDDTEPKYGLSVVGLVEPGKQVSNSGAQPGDSLVLTKPLGTGIITTGCKQGKTPADILAQAVQTMATLNRAASEAMMKVGVNACTDVTGFGLLGHLRSMVRGSGVSARVHFDQVPVLPGAWDLLAQGIVPGGTYRNLQSVEDSVQWSDNLTEEQRLLLCDAQTSGGMLISVSADKLLALLAELERAGVSVRSVVGEVTAGQPGKIQVE